MEPLHPADIRPMVEEEIPETAALVERVFRDFIASAYSEQGIATFLAYASIEGMVRRRPNHRTLVAESEGELLGMVEIREFRHISQLFVAGHAQRNGIGHALLSAALALCRSERPELSEITVNSAPNSQDAYRKWGFEPTDELRTIDGIVFRPMRLRLDGPRNPAE